MTKQRWPFQATTEDKALIDRINAARPMDRTSVADAIRYALRFTVANDKEIAMDERIEIVVSEDSLFGGWEDMALYDMDQSLIEFTELLCARLMQEWTCPISVTPGIMDSMAFGNDNQEDRPEVEEISSEVFLAYEWVRYSEAGKAAGGIDGQA